MRLGILGGSFDPPHNAHIILARLALEQLQLDRVAFVVAASQPFKQASHHASAAHRLRMTALAVAGEAGLFADGRELDRPGPSYSIDTLRELHAEQPGRELVLLMGADVAAGFARWRDPDGVRALARVVVCRRHGEPDPGTGDHTLTMPAIEMSSTAMRARAAAGRPLGGWVPCRVADYIVAANIYGGRSG